MLLDLLVPRDRRQLGHVPQQDAAALEIEDRLLAPGLKLAVDALAGGADENAELLLRDVHLRAEIGGERAKASREANRQRLEHGLFHALALPADALAQQRDDLDPDLRLAFEESEKVFAPQHEQLAGFARGRVRSAALAVQHRNLAEQVARPHEVQREAAAIGGAGLDTDLPSPHAEQRIARVALLE